MSLSQILSKLDLVQDDFPFLERCPAGLNQSGGAPQHVGRFADFALAIFSDRSGSNACQMISTAPAVILMIPTVPGIVPMKVKCIRI